MLGIFKLTIVIFNLALWTTACPPFFLPPFRSTLLALVSALRLLPHAFHLALSFRRFASLPAVSFSSRTSISLL
jgi:hypothetical protein